MCSVGSHTDCTVSTIVEVQQGVKEVSPSTGERGEGGREVEMEKKGKREHASSGGALVITDLQYIPYS